MFDATFYTGLIATGLGLLAAHFIFKAVPMHPTGHYAIGVGLILLGAAIWLLPGNWQVFAGICLIAAVGGLGTLAGYAIDAVSNWRVLARTNDGRRDD